MGEGGRGGAGWEGRKGSEESGYTGNISAAARAVTGWPCNKCRVQGGQADIQAGGTCPRGRPSTHLCPTDTLLPGASVLLLSLASGGLQACENSKDDKLRRGFTAFSPLRYATRPPPSNSTASAPSPTQSHSPLTAPPISPPPLPTPPSPSSFCRATAIIMRKLFFEVMEPPL